MMSIRTFGRAMRIESIGTRVCPPARTRASSPSAASSVHAPRPTSRRADSRSGRASRCARARLGACSAGWMCAASFAGVSGRSIAASPSASATALARQTGVLMQLPSPTPLAPSGVNGDGDSTCRMAGRALPWSSAGDSRRRSRREKRRPAVGELLVKRGTERLREAAGDLTRHHAGMQNAAAVMHRDIFVDAHRARDAIDLDAAEIEDEAVAERRIDLVGVGRRGQLRRRPEYGLADRLICRRERARRPMAVAARRAKWNALSGLPRAATRAARRTRSPPARR